MQRNVPLKAIFPSFCASKPKMYWLSCFQGTPITQNRMIIDNRQCKHTEGAVDKAGVKLLLRGSLYIGNNM